MVTREDLESYMIRMDLDYEEIAEGMYLVRSRDEGLPIVVNHSPPLVILRLKVTDLPETSTSFEKLYRTLLEFNASDVVHGAYGLEGDELVLGLSLQLESMDFGEFQASIESLNMAASSHMQTIQELVSSAPVGG